MPGSGPITNTRSLKGALVETIGQLERARQKPVVVRILRQCRDYRRLVDEWDAVSPPPDEQFETIGQIMQLLGAAMQATKGGGDDEPAIEVHSFDAMGDFDDEDFALDADLDAVLDLDLELDTSASDVVVHEHTSGSRGTGAEVVELYATPWRRLRRGVHVKTLQRARSGTHVLVRLEPDAELEAHTQTAPECIYVLEGCVRHAGALVHAGMLLRVDGGAAKIRSVGESTLIVMGTTRRLLLSRPSPNAID